MAATITVTGLGLVLGNLDRYRSSLGARAQRACDRTGPLVAREAKGFAPVDLARLRATIEYVPGTGGNGRVTAGEGLANEAVAAYVEFGTGEQASIPPDLESYAREFYVNGEGHTPAQPYLFPAAEANRDRHRQHLREEMKP